MQAGASKRLALQEHLEPRVAEHQARRRLLHDPHSTTSSVVGQQQAKPGKTQPSEMTANGWRITQQRRTDSHAACSVRGEGSVGRRTWSSPGNLLTCMLARDTLRRDSSPRGIVQLRQVLARAIQTQLLHGGPANSKLLRFSRRTAQSVALSQHCVCGRAQQNINWPSNRSASLIPGRRAKTQLAN